MDRAIYGLHNGKLIYQLKKGGLIYDGETNKPVSPQPNMAVRKWEEPWIDDNNIDDNNKELKG